MSFDLMVFDAASAPIDRDAFMDWYYEQTEWSEDHDYETIGVSSPSLQNWFMEMIQTFPPMNGEYAPSDERIDEDEDLEAHLTDYSIGHKVIYASLAWSVAEEAITLALTLAQKHGVGFFDANSDEGEILRP